VKLALDGTLDDASLIVVPEPPEPGVKVDSFGRSGTGGLNVMRAVATPVKLDPANCVMAHPRNSSYRV
jgi:hypothetical protein